ncbi:hypothetical protein B0O80DRAFT_462883 [Mortierella sp. GBAus27b]|nr:hypothetical protein B0O80DRAFT_462883 [Mortierella sp. GBAus27b]
MMRHFRHYVWDIEHGDYQSLDVNELDAAIRVGIFWMVLMARCTDHDCIARKQPMIQGQVAKGSAEWKTCSKTLSRLWEDDPDVDGLGQTLSFIFENVGPRIDLVPSQASLRDHVLLPILKWVFRDEAAEVGSELSPKSLRAVGWVEQKYKPDITGCYLEKEILFCEISGGADVANDQKNEFDLYKLVKMGKASLVLGLDLVLLLQCRGPSLSGFDKIETNFGW